jgi:hypothetical protein
VWCNNAECVDGFFYGTPNLKQCNDWRWKQCKSMIIIPPHSLPPPPCAPCTLALPYFPLRFPLLHPFQLFLSFSPFLYIYLYVVISEWKIFVHRSVDCHRRGALNFDDMHMQVLLLPGQAQEHCQVGQDPQG